MKFIDLLREHRVPFVSHGESPHVTEGWIGLVCPFCGRGTDRYGLGFNLAGGYLTCWKCGPHRPADTLAALTGMPLRDAINECRGLERTRRTDAPHTGRLVIPDGVEPMGPAHRRYLRGRGFDPDAIAELWGVQGIAVAPRLQWRLFIPVVLDGVTVSWTTRAIGDRVAPTDRYRGASRAEESVPRHSVLYGADHVWHAVIVHEGPTDVWATGPGAVCTLGTGFGRGQVLRLSRIPVRAICFDNSAAAQRRAWQLARELEPFPGTTMVCRLEGADDPAAALVDAPDELRDLRARVLGDGG